MVEYPDSKFYSESRKGFRIAQFPTILGKGEQRSKYADLKEKFNDFLDQSTEDIPEPDEEIPDSPPKVSSKNAFYDQFSSIKHVVYSTKSRAEIGSPKPFHKPE